MKSPTRLLLAAVAAGTLAYAAPSSAVLTHHWTFDTADTTGSGTFGDPYTVADVVGGTSVVATGIDGGTSMTPGQPGVFGEAFGFVRDNDGDIGGNNVPGNPLDFENGLRTSVTGVAPTGNAERTIMLWFNQALADGQNKLFGYGSNNADADGTTAEAFDFSLEGGGVRLRNFNGNITYGDGFNFAADDGAGGVGANAGWNHLAVRVNAGATTFNDMDVFLNGNLLGLSTTVGIGGDALNDTIATADSAFGIGNIGYDNFLNNNFTGLLDEVRIYDNALTDNEIAALAVNPTIVPGDADGDGDVDDTDLGIAISNFTGPAGTGKTRAEGDTDGDGDVDDTDLGVAISGFTGPLAAAVPEPTSLALLSLGGLLVARRRRA